MNEYNALRNELVSKQNRKTNVWMQMYVLFLTLFSLGISINNKFLLLTYIILIPYQAKINNLEWNVSRISTYIRIFYELENPQMNWESFNTQYEPYRSFLKKEVMGIYNVIRNAGAVHLSILATVSYIITQIMYNITNDVSLINIIVDCLFICLSIVLLHFTFYQNRLEKSRCGKELDDIIMAYKSSITK